MKRDGKRIKNGFLRWEKAIFAAFALCLLLQITGFAAHCGNLESGVVRMHVLANSDSAADQALKLQVRDHLLTVGAEILGAVSDQAEAKAQIQANLPVLQAEAEAELLRQGSPYPVRVSLENTYFPTRTYETVTLPAGRYDALRVEIGEAAGQNWWCVIFPAMCLPAAQESQTLEDVLGADTAQTAESAETYTVAFKTVEIIEKIRSWLYKEA